MRPLIYKNCRFCGMKRVPHRVMENSPYSPVQCENCGTIYRLREIPKEELP